MTHWRAFSSVTGIAEGRLSYELSIGYLCPFGTGQKIPDPTVEQWFNRQQPEQLFLSSVSIAEIRKGLHKIRLARPERHQLLLKWLDKLVSKFSRQILPLTDDVLENWAQLSAEAELRGRKLAVMDALIAATATRHQLTLVTRNVDDFIIPGLLVTNPYLRNL